MKTIHDSLFAHWNTDESGNPISVQTTEQQKVSPIHLCIQLSQIPDEVHRLEVIQTGTSRFLNEVYDIDLLNNNSYKVDYNDGIVWFNESNAGKTFEISYYGRGYKQISSKRIILEDGDMIGVNTLHELVELNKVAVESVMNMNSEFDSKLEEITSYAQLTKMNMDTAYFEIYSDMETYVGDVIRFKSQAIANMKTTIAEFEKLSANADTNMKQSINDFVAMVETNVEELERGKQLISENMTTVLNQFIADANEHINKLETEKNKAQTSMLGQRRDVENAKTETVNAMQDLLNEFRATLQTRIDEMQEIIDVALSKVHDLNLIFQGKQLQWNAEFNDAQLEKQNKFTQSMESKDIEFNTRQETQQNTFNTNQSLHDRLFQDAESVRETIFNEMKEIVYDQNAVLNNKRLTDTKVDTVEKEEVLELIRDANGNVTGSIGGQKIKFYTNKIDEQGNSVKQLLAEHLISGQQSTYLGTEEPLDVQKLWFDPSDEDMLDIKFPENINLAQFQDTVNEIRKDVAKIESATKLDDLCSGTFFSQETWGEEDREALEKQGYTPEEINAIMGTLKHNSTTVDENSSTVNHIRIKVGLNTQLRQLKEGEMAYCSDTERLYIGVRKSPVSTLIENRVIGGKQSESEGGGSGNLTGEYLELDGKDGKKYRIFIDEDGVLKQRESEYLTAEPPKVTEPGVGARFKGLMINRYFGGVKDNGKSPLSHSFIELYNNSSNGQTFNLKGLCIYYKTLDDGTWRRLELTGYIPANHSYLIRGNRLNDPKNSSCRYHVEKFDKHWNMDLSDKSAMIYLGVDYGTLTIPNPFSLSDGTQLAGYIDLLAGASKDEKRSLTALEYDKTKEPRYRNYLSQDVGIQRIDFSDKNVTYTDIEPVNYRTCDINVYRPRCVEDGAWDLYYNKTKLNQNIPNLLNIQFGKEWHTRTFTWQSKVMERGFLKYRKVGETRWTFVDTHTQIVYHADQDCTIHRCIVRNLEEGFYEYQAGDEGCWSDIATFEVKSYKGSNGVYDKTQHIKFMQVSDQQSFYESDYEAWRWASKYIEDNENPDDFDFVINVGDISQSGARSFEWRCYWKHPRFLKEKPHMLTVGNNDLYEKIHSNCFKYYDTKEEDFDGNIYSPNIQTHEMVQGKSNYGTSYASCHSYDIGYVHFMTVNSCAMGTMEDPDIIVKQMNWIRQDMQQARMRPNPPRWFVLHTHYGAFTVCRMKMPQQLIPFVEDLGIHVVVCAHHHTYSRSTPIKMNIREEVERITGHDLYDVYDGCGSAIANAVYGIGYLETFANENGIHVLPSGVTYDQTTETGANADGSQGIATNGNQGSREAYVNNEKGTVWVMSQASGAKLKSNKDLEKTPTPWYYGWCKYDEQTGYTNHPHPYDPNYVMWDISWDKITVKSHIVKNIMEFDDFLKDATIIRPEVIDYSKMYKETIDDFEISWRDLTPRQ